MKPIRRRNMIRDLSFVLLIVVMPRNASSQTVEFVDKTGERYKGNETALSSVKVDSFSIDNIREIINHTKGNLVISWKTVDRTERGNTLESYEINFEVFNRQGSQVFEGSKKWEKGVSGGDSQELAFQSLDYGKIIYWLSSIDVSNDHVTNAKKDEASLKLKKELIISAQSEIQKGFCDLSKSAYCADYSKNISYGDLKLGSIGNIEAFAKKKNLLVKKMAEPTENRYFLYKDIEAQRNGARLLTIFASKDHRMTYFSWSNGPNGLERHIEGVRLYMKIPNDKMLGSFIEIAEGPTFLSQTKIYSVLNNSASVGVRPPEISPGKAELLQLWQGEIKTNNRYESGIVCEKENGKKCDEAIVGFGDFGHKLKLIKLTTEQMKNSYIFYYKTRNGKITRSLSWIDLEGCNMYREYAYRTNDNFQNGLMQQSECFSTP